MKKRDHSIDRTICVPYNHLTVQSPDSCTSSWSSVSPLWHFSSFLFHFPCTPITNQSDRVHFSPLRGWMKIKSKAKWSTRGITCFDSWWLGVWRLLCSLPACLLGCLPARLPVCSFPSTLMESCSLLAVTPSSHQEWLIMVLNIDLCLTCVKIPPTL